MPREVRGVLFADPVRMIRAAKQVDWNERLSPQDLQWLSKRIDPEGWYPIDAYERLALAVLEEIARGDFAAVRAWGREMADAVANLEPRLLATGDPRELFMRFQLLRQALFNFPAVEVVALREGAALLELRFGLGASAEEAAAANALGLLEALLEASGAAGVAVSLQSRSWQGEGPTRIAVGWKV
ncbi:MAG: hypothetical protein ACRD2J_08240 [Thermoanaerobaculia bacterium]